MHLSSCAVQVGAPVRVSPKEFRELTQAAQAQHCSVEAMVNAAVAGTVSNLLKSAK